MISNLALDPTVTNAEMTDKLSNIIDYHKFRRMVLLESTPEKEDIFLVETREDEYFIVGIKYRVIVVPKGMINNLEDIQQKTTSRYFHTGKLVDELAAKYLNSGNNAAKHLLQQLKY